MLQRTLSELESVSTLRDELIAAFSAIAEKLHVAQATSTAVFDATNQQYQPGGSTIAPQSTDERAQRSQLVVGNDIPITSLTPAQRAARQEQLTYEIALKRAAENVKQVWSTALEDVELKLRETVGALPLETEKDEVLLLDVLRSIASEPEPLAETLSRMGGRGGGQLTLSSPQRQAGATHSEAVNSTSPTAGGASAVADVLMELELQQIKDCNLRDKMRGAAAMMQQRVMDLESKLARCVHMLSLSRARNKQRAATVKYIQATLYKEVMTLHEQLLHAAGEQATHDRLDSNFVSFIDFLELVESQYYTEAELAVDTTGIHHEISRAGNSKIIKNVDMTYSVVKGPEAPPLTEAGMLKQREKAAQREKRLKMGGTSAVLNASVDNSDATLLLFTPEEIAHEGDDHDDAGGDFSATFASRLLSESTTMASIADSANIKNMSGGVAGVTLKEQLRGKPMEAIQTLLNQWKAEALLRDENDGKIDEAKEMARKMADKAEELERTLHVMSTKFGEEAIKMRSTRLQQERKFLKVSRELSGAQSRIIQLESKLLEREDEVEEYERRTQELKSELELEQLKKTAESVENQNSADAADAKLQIERRKINKIINKIATGKYTSVAELRAVFEDEDDDPNVVDFLRGVEEIQDVEERIGDLREEIDEARAISRMAIDKKEWAENILELNARQLRQCGLPYDRELEMFLVEKYGEKALERTAEDEEKLEEFRRKQEAHEDLSDLMDVVAKECADLEKCATKLQDRMLKSAPESVGKQSSVVVEDPAPLPISSSQQQQQQSSSSNVTSLRRKSRARRRSTVVRSVPEDDADSVFAEPPGPPREEGTNRSPHASQLDQSGRSLGASQQADVSMASPSGMLGETLAKVRHVMEVASESLLSKLDVDERYIERTDGEMKAKQTMLVSLQQQYRATTEQLERMKSKLRGGKSSSLSASKQADDDMGLEAWEQEIERTRNLVDEQHKKIEELTKQREKDAALLEASRPTVPTKNSLSQTDPCRISLGDEDSDDDDGSSTGTSGVAARGGKKGKRRVRDFPSQTTFYTETENQSAQTDPPSLDDDENLGHQELVEQYMTLLDGVGGGGHSGGKGSTGVAGRRERYVCNHCGTSLNPTADLTTVKYSDAQVQTDAHAKPKSVAVSRTVQTEELVELCSLAEASALTFSTSSAQRSFSPRGRLARSRSPQSPGRGGFASSPTFVMDTNALAEEEDPFSKDAECQTRTDVRVIVADAYRVDASAMTERIGVKHVAVTAARDTEYDGMLSHHVLSTATVGTAMSPLRQSGSGEFNGIPNSTPDLADVGATQKHRFGSAGRSRLGSAGKRSDAGSSVGTANMEDLDGGDISWQLHQSSIDVINDPTTTGTPVVGSRNLSKFRSKFQVQTSVQKHKEDVRAGSVAGERPLSQGGLPPFSKHRRGVSSAQPSRSTMLNKTGAPATVPIPRPTTTMEQKLRTAQHRAKLTSAPLKRTQSPPPPMFHSHLPGDHVPSIPSKALVVAIEPETGNEIFPFDDQKALLSDAFEEEFGMSLPEAKALREKEARVATQSMQDPTVRSATAPLLRQHPREELTELLTVATASTVAQRVGPGLQGAKLALPPKRTVSAASKTRRGRSSDPEI